MSNDDLERLELPEPAAYMLMTGCGTGFMEGPNAPDSAIPWTELYTAYQLRAAILAERQRRPGIKDSLIAAEPIGWFTEDHLTDKSATTYSREVAERWKAKGWPVTAFFTRAAPAEVTDAMVERAIQKLSELSRHATWSAGYHRVVKEALEAALGGGE